MKVAVICGGQLRSFLQCKESIENHILSKNNCTFFVYTDTEIAGKTTNWRGKKYLLPSKGIENLYKNSIKEVTKLVQKYNCTKQQDKNEYLDRLLVEPHDIKLEVPDWWEKEMGSYSYEGFFYANYNKKQVFSLLQRYCEKYKENFDYVLFIRPDIFFDEDICIEKEIKKLPEIKLEKHYSHDNFIVMCSPIDEMSKIDNLFRGSTYMRNVACDTVFWGPYNSFLSFLPTLPEEMTNTVAENLGVFNLSFEAIFWLVLFKKNISRYALYRNYLIVRLKRPKKFSSILKVRIRKTSTQILLFKNVNFRTIMCAFVLFGYPFYFQIFSDKYIKISNYYERDKK